MPYERTLYFCRKQIAIYRHCAARRNARYFAGAHDQTVQPPHLVVKQSHRVLVAIIRTEAVRTDQFRKCVGLVSGSHFAAAAHLAQADLEPALRELPGCLATRQSAADDVNVVCHCQYYLFRRT
jgi:hypothetical protein